MTMQNLNKDKENLQHKEKYEKKIFNIRKNKKRKLKKQHYKFE